MKKLLIIGFAVIACISLIIVPFSANNSFEAAFTKTVGVFDKIGVAFGSVFDFIKGDSGVQIVMHSYGQSYLLLDYIERDGKNVVFDWKVIANDKGDWAADENSLILLLDSISYFETESIWYKINDRTEVRFYDVDGKLIFTENNFTKRVTFDLFDTMDSRSISYEWYGD